MKGEINEAMFLFLRKGDKIGEQDHAVRQPATAESDREQLLLLETGQREGGFWSAGTDRFRVVRGCHRFLIFIKTRRDNED